MLTWFSVCAFAISVLILSFPFQISNNMQLLFSYISLFLFRLLIMRHVNNLAEDICKNSFIFIEENKCDKCANRFRIKWKERIYFEETRRWFIQYICVQIPKYICVHSKKISYMYKCGFRKRRQQAEEKICFW